MHEICADLNSLVLVLGERGLRPSNWYGGIEGYGDLADWERTNRGLDYRNPAPLAQIGSPADVEQQFVAPSGLRVRGNREFHDSGLRYLRHPSLHGEYTFGALFQEL